MKITHRYTGATLFEAEANSVSDLVNKAIVAKADLSGANLRGANLRWANLGGADLSGADLSGAKYDESHMLRAITQVGSIGSRGDWLVVYLLDDNSVRVHTGCFRGTLDEFRAAVEKKHSDNRHGREYRAALDFITAWAQAQEAAG